MKKINRIKEASVRLFAIIVVIIIAIAGLMLFMQWGSTSYWETETGFGVWQDELTIEFADGTTESMKIIQENIKPFTVYYDGKAISKASLEIKAQATGSGYDGAELRITKLGSTAYIRKGTTILQTVTGYTSDRIKTIPMGATESICQIPVDLQYIIDEWQPEKYPSGTYNVLFVTKGTAEYRGYPDGGDWVTASLPPDRSISITVERTPTGSIMVTLTSDVVT